MFVYELSGCGFKSCCSHQVKKLALSKSYKVTWEPSLANTFPILIAGLTRGKKLYAQEFLIATWLHFFTLKANAQYPLNIFRKKIQVFFNCYLAVHRQTLGHSGGDSFTNLRVTGSFVISLGP